MIGTERDFQLAAVYQPEERYPFMHVAQVVGDMRPVFVSAHIERVSRDIVNVRAQQGMTAWGAPAVQQDMASPEGGTYIAAYAHGSILDPSLFDRGTFDGYLLRGPLRVDEPVAIQEIAVAKGLSEDEMHFAIGSLFAVALDHPEVDLASSVAMHSRLPSTRGVRVVGRLGLRRNLSGRMPGFFGHAGDIMERLDFLGHNLHRQG
jgi:hypothetical protein